MTTVFAPPAQLIVGDPDAPFWEAWTSGCFLLHRCDACGRHYWPASCCVYHGLAPMRWIPASGYGTVETYTVFYHAFAPEFAADVPYNISVIRLDEGPLFHSRVVGLGGTALATGLRVKLSTTAGGREMPLFMPARI